MIKRLETTGLFTKEAHPQDELLNVLNITEKSHKIILKIHHKVAEFKNTIEDQVGASSLGLAQIKIQNSDGFVK
jgi:DNA-binding MarR family transcriptional regulator